MSKSKKRFSQPQRWAAEASRSGLYACMTATPSGGYVRMSDYEELRRAYVGALVQLDRASRLVAELKRGTR